MVLHNLAESWSKKLCDTASRTDPYQQALTTYALEGYLAVLYDLAFIVLLGWLCGVLQQALLIALTAGFLKSVSGGFHLSTPSRCALAAAFVFTGLGLLLGEHTLGDLGVYLVVPVLAFDNIMVWLYAPASVPQKPLSDRQRQALKYLSRVCMACLTAVCLVWRRPSWTAAVAVGATMQALMLTGLMRKLFTALDRTLDHSICLFKQIFTKKATRRCRE